MNDPVFSPHAGRDWLPFASLELPFTKAAVEQLESWLASALDPLALPADFAGKVLASARDSAAGIPAESRHIRLQVYTSTARPARGQTWGFFRIKKSETTSAYPAFSLHAIALYLYVEDPPRLD